MKCFKCRKKITSHRSAAILTGKNVLCSSCLFKRMKDGFLRGRKLDSFVADEIYVGGGVDAETGTKGHQCPRNEIYHMGQCLICQRKEDKR